MRLPIYLIAAAITLAACTTPTPVTSRPRVEPTRITQSFDAEWRFLKGDTAGAENPAHADDTWRVVSLPHDWSIEGPFDRANPTGGAGGFLPSGVGWYRKAFTLPASAQGRRVFVEFDGVMHNSDVWLNGHHLGHRPNGYVSFRYDLTPYLNVQSGAPNVLAVRTDTSKQPASRWYSGAGIYRHVRLVLTNVAHIEPWSTFVSTDEAPSASHATAAIGVKAKTQVVNKAAGEGRFGVRFTLIDPAGQSVAVTTTDTKAIPAGATGDFAVEFHLPEPKRWDINSPNLYRLHVAVISAGTETDGETVTFGIRSAVFDTNLGFLLNGRIVKLLGVCLHHDGGAFGAAVPLAVWEQRLTTLRTLGVNAIRTAHNPPDPGFLDLCDRMGFLVMDELFDCWTVGKNPHDYHLFFSDWWKPDLRDTVLRDRNHPSVVLYSAGNEIHDTPKEELAKGILRGIVAAFHEYDLTRPVTQALFRPNVSHDYTNGLADLLDVIGTNYRDQELLAAWRAKRGRKILGTEQQHGRDTWLALRDNPQHAGQFLWTGIDYLGESRTWPVIANGSGLLDRTGAIKPIGRQRQSWWSTAPMVAILRRTAPTVVSPYDPGYEPATAELRRREVLFADWTPANQHAHEETVEVYSNCETVELILEGRSLGSKPLNPDASPRVWKVAYAPGTLRAVGQNSGNDAAVAELKTAGPAAAIILKAERDAVSPDWEDVVLVTATVVDTNGVIVPNATDPITFAVEGPGTVVAVDNGDLASTEPFQATQRRPHQGRCVAFVRATATQGDVVIRAAAPGLQPGATTIRAVPAGR